MLTKEKRNVRNQDFTIVTVLVQNAAAWRGLPNACPACANVFFGCVCQQFTPKCRQVPPPNVHIINSVNTLLHVILFYSVAFRGLFFCNSVG